MTSIKLNLGCGSVRPESWINTDSSLNANLQKIPLIGKIITRPFNKVVYEGGNMVYMNLNKRWKYSDNTVDIVYASHLFEHLSLSAARLFLAESYRCLKPGGVIRLVVPDLYKICKKYISDYESGIKDDTTEFIMWAINMHREGQYGSDIGLIKKTILEGQGYPHQHKFMYDEKSLGKKMAENGFTGIRSLSYGVSEYIPQIKDVEGTQESYLSVYLEALKKNI
ncbi:MAG: methyltransferase domain-containing protein [Ferruginibacter sp.]